MDIIVKSIIIVRLKFDGRSDRREYGRRAAAEPKGCRNTLQRRGWIPPSVKGLISVGCLGEISNIASLGKTDCKSAALSIGCRSRTQPISHPNRYVCPLCFKEPSQVSLV